MNELAVFSFEGHEVRTVVDNKEVYFVGRDICQRLGYTNESKAMNDHCRGVTKRYPIVDNLGRTQEVRVLTQSDVLRLIVNSHLPEAQKFEAWVFEEVLPTILKKGSYASPKTNPLKPITVAARLLPTLIKAAKSIGCDNNAAVISASQAVKRLTDVDLLETLGQTHLIAQKQENFYTPTELGKELNINARQVNLLLAEAGMQLKRGEVWEATEAGKEFARIYDTGKKHGSGVPITQIKWSINVLQLLNKEKEAA